MSWNNNNDDDIDFDFADDTIPDGRVDTVVVVKAATIVLRGNVILVHVAIIIATVVVDAIFIIYIGGGVVG